MWQVVFGEAFSVTGGNFAEHIFVKCSPPKEFFFDSQIKHWSILSFLAAHGDVIERLLRALSFWCRSFLLSLIF